MYYFVVFCLFCDFFTSTLQKHGTQRTIAFRVCYDVKCLRLENAFTTTGGKCLQWRKQTFPTNEVLADSTAIDNT